MNKKAIRKNKIKTKNKFHNVLQMQGSQPYAKLFLYLLLTNAGTSVEPSHIQYSYCLLLNTYYCLFFALLFRKSLKEFQCNYYVVCQ